MQIFHLLQM